MRMTNKIMQSNSLYNINQTKLQEDKYNTQLTSQSKITRPSDDPVIAIRALRLRSNVSTVTQYYEKNSPDANQWLDVTAQALNTITSVMTNLYNQVQTGVNKDYTASDMEVLLTQIEAYTSEMYATGNQDYAGRYIFTGYRTDTALTMNEDELNSEFKITENISDAQIDTLNYTDFSVFDNTTSAATAIETNITNATINRIRLSYDELKDGITPTITIKDNTGATASEIKSTDFVPYDDTDATTKATSLANDYVSFDSAEAAYQAMTKVQNGVETQPQVAFIASTGEILYSDSFTVGGTSISDYKADGGSISINYEKNKWNIEDLNPKHYFTCVDEKNITYNADGNLDTQITYDVGYNQVIQVNTNAYEVFDPAITRDYEDLKYLVSQFSSVEKLRTQYQEELDSLEETDPKYATVKKQYDAADKAYTYVRDAVSKRFGEQITKYQAYLDATNVAITKNGTRSTRLELISSRLSDQKTTFKELQEENEGIDMTEVAVKLTAAETTYDAALLATSKIMQNSLINYI